MFNKIARYTFIVFGLLVMWASTSRTAMQYISGKRDGVKWWCSYPMKHGDLISMSYLDFVKKLNPDRPPMVFKRPVSGGQKNTVLYLYGDSYTWHLADSNFAGVQELKYIERSHGGVYHLDRSRRNVLVLEVAERALQVYYNSLRIFDDFKDSIAEKNTVNIHCMPASLRPRYASLLTSPVDFFFNKLINQNLQCNLFNYNFIIPIFEYKAALNYYVFNRASGDVVISEDKNFLFLKQTVSREDIGSSYRPLQTNEIKQLVANFNAIYDHYKSKGFNEVYLSVIPNSATIVQPAGYNNLIPLLQNDPDLKMKIIDIYHRFKNSPGNFYLPGDTHWNHNGLQLWLDVVNERLIEIERQTDDNSGDKK
jgi:hypothetical protein